MLILNQNYFFHGVHELSKYPGWVSESNAQSLSHLPKDSCLLWVQHPINSVWWPWFMPSSPEAMLTELQNPTKASPKISLRGLAMGLLIDNQRISVQRRNWVNALESARVNMEPLDYAVIPKVFSPLYGETVRYYLTEVRPSMVPDDQVLGRLALHNAALFSSVHSQLTGLVQATINAEAIKASYCYLSIYPQGAELKRHTDREQCRWNASVIYAAESPNPWPIYIESKGKTREIKAGVGDMVIYRGDLIPHWRNPLPEGTATICFYHFVLQNFQGTLR